MTWYPFTPETMPPVDGPRFLYLHGTGKGDRILGVGKRVSYSGESYIRVVGGNNGWHILDDGDLEDALWAPLEITDADVRAAKAMKRRILKNLREGLKAE